MYSDDEKTIQRNRYTSIAARYDRLHDDPEHVVALSFLHGMLGQIGVGSVLDVGAGTGRAMTFLRQVSPNLRVVGVEPVEELRNVGHQKGIPVADLIDGDGYNLEFSDGEFDLVCEVGVLHHVRDPNRVVAEMLRVARKAIFISDSNNFGGGSAPMRLIKQLLRDVGLWGVANYLKTGGRGYSITEGDGLFYSYSVFDSLKLIQEHCRIVHMLNTTASGPNLYRTASNVAVIGIK
ncbi:class I SAM-dependent methyltransferase [Thiococcus pfennigii]|jgi:SAM-dependent methyltransferase|uniref:class I SAM-dependent methyltransferase n=1 Tax=Thiococcus pfennigii TaxID=1057 RepID=UPI001905DAE9|nr:class I SAM-dependent methyltransferase [Thiococcus pfennigii]MBK1699575.1 SAM-dependent methyltransferase [Thiococcus pfennigii]MBK1733111.1 SAM-dependent methyltransferase [Thiococcus pfennigii]